MPVVLIGLEVDGVARPNLLDRSSAALTKAEALCDVDRLPEGCVCQAVRAPGVKWTLAAARRDGAVGVAIVSTKTALVNQSAGPGDVVFVFLVICTSCSFRPKLGGVDCGWAATSVSRFRYVLWFGGVRSGVLGATFPTCSFFV